MVSNKHLELGLLNFTGLAITQLNFSSSGHDSALFTRKTDNGIVVLLLYVDGMIITGDDSVGIEGLKKFLCEHFVMKDLGQLSNFLGLEVLSSSDSLFLSQAKYMLLILSLEQDSLIAKLNTLLLNPTLDLLLKTVLCSMMLLFIGNS